MEGEPVIALAQDFTRYRSRLLGDQDGSQVIFPAFLDPGNVGSFSGTPRAAEDRLGFFHDCNDWDGLRLCFCEFFLVVIEYPSQDKSGKNKGRRTPHLGHVDNAYSALSRAINMSIIWLLGSCSILTTMVMLALAAAISAS